MSFWLWYLPDSGQLDLHVYDYIIFAYSTLLSGGGNHSSKRTWTTHTSPSTLNHRINLVLGWYLRSTTVWLQPPSWFACYYFPEEGFLTVQGTSPFPHQFPPLRTPLMLQAANELLEILYSPTPIPSQKVLLFSPTTKTAPAPIMPTGTQIFIEWTV